MVQEIIEIGAIKVNRFGEILGQFNRFVKPVMNPLLSRFCRQLTTIEQAIIDRAGTFPDVVEDFQEWAGVFDGEEYLLCSWGGFDQRMLVQDCQLHKIESDWVAPHLNVKKQYHEIKRWRNYKGLRKVVELEGFEFTGTYHRGVSDAQNLAKVFVKYIDEWQY
jgi:inhibitor of KinA sporulation pathway (predicted exonuclease)